MQNSLEEFPILSSDRFDLIEIKDAHVEDIFKLYSNLNVTKYFDLLPLQTKEEAVQAVKFYQKRFQDKIGIRWGIAFKEQTVIIGTLGFNKIFEGHKGRIGYDLQDEYWGNGYMREVLDCIISYGFKQFNLKRIEAEVMQGNIGSEKLLEKLNFQKEGILRQWMYWNDTLYDISMYSLLESDYKIENSQ